jgi:ADP-ribose pyrophosphatase YjhB (NUDIX family)
MKFCTHCGNHVTLAIPAGDNRERHLCGHCGEIHYQNPKIVAGCIPVWDDKILLCKRAIEPRKGYWTIPAGFLENGESIEEGAARETWEEACAPIVDLQLYQIYNLTRISQVYILFRAQLRDATSFGVGEESLEVELVAEKEIPWDEIAFKVVHKTLTRFLSERRTENFNFEIDSIR